MLRRELLLLLLGASACGRGRPRADQAGSTAGSAGAATGEPGPPATPSSPPTALGSLDDIPPTLRPAFDPSAHRPPPQLPSEGEPPQSFADFLAERSGRAGPPQPGARTIVILPIGEYPRGFVVEYDLVRLVRSPELALIARFIEAWFGLPVRVLPPIDGAVLEALPAREHQGTRQLDATAILAWMRKQLPADAACLLALTLEDLYGEDAEWMFGYASIPARVGVHSMLRYDPGFADTNKRGPDFEATILARALRVLAHEVAHMFGLRHCVHFACVMNPTSGIADLDRLPLHLCPVCLRKLWTVSGSSLMDRWEQLFALCDELSLDADREWFRARLRALGIGLLPVR